MRTKSLIVTLAPMAALVLSAAAPLTQPGDALLAPRIRAHFDSVLVELQQRDVTALTPVQRASRSALVNRLERYKERGVFPHNYDFPGQAVPYFVDRKTGTLCAVAHLLASTGRRDIVERVASANNNVWVMELRGDAAFERWLRDNGLSLEEAARIQVPYVEPTPIMEREFAGPMPPAAPLLGLSAAGVTVLNFLGNRDGSTRLLSWAGMVSGVANVAIGASLMHDGRHQAMGRTNVGLGVLSAIMSTSTIVARREVIAARKDAARNRVAVAPVVPISDVGAGLSVSVRF